MPIEIPVGDLALRDVEVMRSLEGAEDWEKLEVWMAAVWQHQQDGNKLISTFLLFSTYPHFNRGQLIL